MNSPLVLIILDGWGHAEPDTTNAISLAKTPNWDEIWNNHPHSLLCGSGLEVGLPEGQMGNSEVGHMTIGAGRVIYQDLTLINKAIADHSFEKNPIFRQALINNNTIHILGLLSPGGVHSHEEHIFAMIKLAASTNNKVVVHPFLDGRDTPPRSAQESLQKLADLCATLPNVVIANIMGRFYAMDRDNRHERTEAAINLLVHNKATFNATNVLDGLQAAYDRDETDEFVQPTSITSDVIAANDTVIFMNFRTDRARQLSYALTKALPINLITLTEYDPKLPAKVAFPKQPINNIFSQVTEKHNITQLHVAETEKYAHVTFFFNAGREEPFCGETRILIPSPKVATYDLEPSMGAEAITDALVEAIANKKYQVIICNYANADMVGHTGKLAPAIKAIECIDQCLGRIMNAITEFGGEAIITADHGNAEVMWDKGTKQAHTAHTANLVPVVYLGGRKLKFRPGTSGLKDIAPSMLELLNIDKPTEMTGTSMLIL